MVDCRYFSSGSNPLIPYSEYVVFYTCAGFGRKDVSTCLLAPAFCAADRAHEFVSMWDQLFDDQGFKARWGLRTAERRHPCYNFTVSRCTRTQCIAFGCGCFLLHMIANSPALTEYLRKLVT